MEQQIKEYDSLIDLLEAQQQQGASPAALATIMERYIEQKARLSGVPLRGTLELTPLCNLDCKMCYVHLTKQQYEKQPCSMLTGVQWIGIIEQAIALGLQEVTLTGGEALLHPDFDEIFLFLEKNHVRVNLKTNGLLLTDERLAFLLKHHLTSIQISLYGSDDESYEMVTGRRSYKQVMEGIERVRAAGIPLEIVITPSKYMWTSIEHLLRTVNGMGVRYTISSGLIDPFEETGRADENHDLTLEQYIQLYRMRASLIGFEFTKPCPEDVPKIGNQNQERVKGLRCAAGRSVFCVTWRGDILPCRALESICFDGLKTPFAEAWSRINSKVREYPTPRECVGCEFEGLCPNCVVQHGMGAEIGHANKALCYRAKRLFEEGILSVRKKGEIIP